MKGKCEKCGTNGWKRNPITRHHIYPKRFYRGAGPIAILCRRCHDKLERMIPFEPKRSRIWYQRVYKRFLESK